MNFIEKEMSKIIYKKIESLSFEDSNKLLEIKDKIKKQEKYTNKIVNIFFVTMTTSTLSFNLSLYLGFIIFFASLALLIIPAYKSLDIRKTNLDLFNFFNIDILQEYKNIILKYLDEDKGISNIEKDFFIKKQIDKIEKMQKSKHLLNKEILKYVDIIREKNDKKLDCKLITKEIDIKQRLLNLDLKVKQ